MDPVGTHQRCLLAAVLRTTGPILEVGCGWYSTPLLAEVSRATQRVVCSCDDSEEWLEALSKAIPPTSYHHYLKVEAWKTLIVERLYDVAFIDNAPAGDRLVATKVLLSKNEPTIFVFHDTESDAYAYDVILRKFRYKCYDRTHETETCIASNRVDVSLWL